LGVAMAINSLAYNESIRKEFRERQAAEALVELIRLTKDKVIEINVVELCLVFGVQFMSDKS
jgi:hypothetical protein